MYCTGRFLWSGVEENCQERCQGTGLCRYYTAYSSNRLCQLSQSCDTQMASNDPTARTFYIGTLPITPSLPPLPPPWRSGPLWPCVVPLCPQAQASFP